MILFEPSLLFFLVSLTKGWSVLLIFLKNQTLVLLIFFYFLSILYVIYFCTDFNPFLLLSLGFVLSSFSSSFRCKVRLFIWNFCYILRQPLISMNFSLITALELNLFTFKVIDKYVLSDILLIAFLLFCSFSFY